MIIFGGLLYVIFVACISPAMGPYDYAKDHQQPRVESVAASASAPEVK